MPETKRQFYVQPKTYRGQPGWHIGSRGGHGFPISIHVAGRTPEAHERAITIRDAYRHAESGVISRELCETIVDEVLLRSLR